MCLCYENSMFCVFFNQARPAVRFGRQNWFATGNVAHFQIYTYSWIYAGMWPSFLMNFISVPDDVRRWRGNIAQHKYTTYFNNSVQYFCLFSLRFGIGNKLQVCYIGKRKLLQTVKWLGVNLLPNIIPCIDTQWSICWIGSGIQIAATLVRSDSTLSFAIRLVPIRELFGSRRTIGGGQSKNPCH